MRGTETITESIGLTASRLEASEEWGCEEEEKEGEEWEDEDNKNDGEEEEKEEKGEQTRQTQVQRRTGLQASGSRNSMV